MKAVISDRLWLNGVIKVDRCRTLSDLVADEPDVVAAINAGFFDAEQCLSVSLVRVDGRDLAFNAVSRTSLGLKGDGESATIDRIEAGTGWPEVRQALGGGPRLVGPGGGVNVTRDEGFQGTLNGRNPRTAACLAPGGRQLTLVVADGRTDEGGVGVTLEVSKRKTGGRNFPAKWLSTVSPPGVP